MLRAFAIISGEGEIRTPGTFRYAGFQDRTENLITSYAAIGSVNAQNLVAGMVAGTYRKLTSEARCESVTTVETDSPPADVELREVIQSWPALSRTRKEAILTLCRSQPRAGAD